ncbi:MAG: helix-turn-helix transcriptional regulator [Deltaproteobacteria bacterium]|nr:helix-turn-helix transcriptional regulator [Deltaproteobacteria bacterium]
MDRKLSISQDTARARIASEVRALRQARGWTLTQLAEKLGRSPSRLSEIERGGGSFTAEQFLALLAIFNVPATHFTPPTRDGTEQLQNALARLGATSLYENDSLTPSEQLRTAHQAIREALLEGSPRLVTALAPVLVANIDQINPAKLVGELVDVGYERRLGWVVDNTIAAINTLPRSEREPRLQHARARLPQLADVLHKLRSTSNAAEDVLDRSIRTQRTLDQVRREASPISHEWKIVTAIQPDDFASALRASLERD